MAGVFEGRVGGRGVVATLSANAALAYRLPRSIGELAGRAPLTCLQSGLSHVTERPNGTGVSEARLLASVALVLARGAVGALVSLLLTKLVKLPGRAAVSQARDVRQGAVAVLPRRAVQARGLPPRGLVLARGAVFAARLFR